MIIFHVYFFLIEYFEHLYKVIFLKWNIFYTIIKKYMINKKKTNIHKKLINHFNNLKIKKNSNLVIHSNLLSFGILDQKLPEIILEILTNLIGSKGNIAIPSYNIHKKDKRIYDDKILNFRNSGSLSKIFFEKYVVSKSKSIFHSHIIIGPLSKNFSSRSFYGSFGLKSDFNFFLKNKFNLLLLGCDANEGCTYLHNLEYLEKVPYRISKKIKIKFIKNKKKIFREFIYPTRRKKIHVNLNNIFFNKLLKNKTICASLNSAKSYKIKIYDLDKLTRKLLRENKNILLNDFTKKIY